MRLLRAKGDKLILDTFHIGKPPYAILSHRWLPDEEEVTYEDIIHQRGSLTSKKGWKKLDWCRKQAVKDKLDYVWADTACIDKSSSQELTESINMMYAWYQASSVCYVYLHDMPDHQPATTLPRLEERTYQITPRPLVDVPHDTQENSSSTFVEPDVSRSDAPRISVDSATDALFWLRQPEQPPLVPSEPTHDLLVQTGGAEYYDPLSIVLNAATDAITNNEGECAAPSFSREMDVQRARAALENMRLFDSTRSERASTQGNVIQQSPRTCRQQIWERWDKAAFAKSEWHTRAWTLQEMIAPSNVQFFSQTWSWIGDVVELAEDVAEITKVDSKVLTKQRPVRSYSIAQRMSWAAGRRSTKEEDRAVCPQALAHYMLIQGGSPSCARYILIFSRSGLTIRQYSLLGIMDVVMPVVYGEGNRAFQRLQDELLRTSPDDSIFAFSLMGKARLLDGQLVTPLLAESPSDFAGCGDIVFMDDTRGNEHQTLTKLVNFKSRMIESSFWEAITSSMDTLRPNRRRRYKIALLHCRRAGKPFSMLGLRLLPRAGVSAIFYVDGNDDTRIEELSVYEERYRSSPYKTFSVVRVPGQVDLLAKPKLSVTCYSRTRNMTMELGTTSLASGQHEVDPETHAFTIPMDRLGDPNQALPTCTTSLELLLAGAPVAKMSLSMHPSRWRFVRLKFDGPALHLPDWTTSILHRRSYYASVRWHDRSFLIIKAFAKLRPLGRRDIVLLECERVGYLRFAFFLFARLILMFLSTLSLFVLPATFVYLYVGTSHDVVVTIIFILGQVSFFIPPLWIIMALRRATAMPLPWNKSSGGWKGVADWILDRVEAAPITDDTTNNNEFNKAWHGLLNQRYEALFGPTSARRAEGTDMV